MAATQQEERATSILCVKMERRSGASGVRIRKYFLAATPTHSRRLDLVRAAMVSRRVIQV